jgi:hypothetical protein
MARSSTLPLLFLWTVLAAACDGPEPLSPEPAAQSAPAPHFAQVFQEVFSGFGCTNGYCHGSSGMLAMRTAEETYAGLVGVQARGVDCAGIVRVVAGDPAQSLLWRKLSPDAPACGKKMPYGRDPLPPAKLELVRRWIEGGALP